MSKLVVRVTKEEESEHTEAPTLWDMIADTVYQDLKNGGRDSDEPVYCERPTGFSELMTHYGE